MSTCRRVFERNFSISFESQGECITHQFFIHFESTVCKVYNRKIGVQYFKNKEEKWFN